MRDSPLGAFVVMVIIAMITMFVISSKRTLPQKDNTYYPLLPDTSGTAAVQLVPARAYQIELINDSLYIYDGRRYVGRVFFTDDTEIGALIYEDNDYKEEKIPRNEKNNPIPPHN
jgi:hypothetical protein